MSRVRVYNPTTSARRKTSVIVYKEVLTGDKPHKKLIVRKKSAAGRNDSGKITVRHRGGGSRRLVRKINFKRNFELGFKVLTVEYDPIRTAFICLVADLKTGKKHYILHSKGMNKGLKYNLDDEMVDGNSVFLQSLPIGTFVSQIEINPKQGAKLVRSAGNYAIVTAKDDKWVTLKLPSGEIRKFLGECRGVINKVGNEAHELVRLGKAGRVRNKGIRPTVRGKVMNPVDHPHGGGEARNSIGMKYPKTPWGKHALGVKTRNKKLTSSKFILKRRAKKR
ncbi:MAG: 50S ribosomal protein L2 [Patescibacteria group bacterium]